MATNVFEVFARLSLDNQQFDKDLGESKSMLSKFGDVVKTTFSTFAKIGTVAFTGATTAVTALTKSATDAYGEYQQLSGGIETLMGVGGKSLEEFAETAKVTKADIENSGIDWSKYADAAWFNNGGLEGLFDEMQYNFDELGTSAEELQEYLQFEYDLDTEDAIAAINAYKDALSDTGIEKKYESAMMAQETVMKNAANAYKTAGMSANDYKDTVINMAASLNKATGDTEESARLADMAITDMADNVNKMGTNMESVQNAYKGFTRANFTMLDNLALGYAGTKEGMEELLEAAQQISGVEYDIDSYADIVQAIHVVQTEMGITGTTAEEAADTIQGSTGSMKAAWDNLVAGLADPKADIGTLVQNFVSSAVTAFENLKPTIEQELKGIGTLVTELAPEIFGMIPTLLKDILPDLLAAALEMTGEILDGLADLGKMVYDEVIVPAWDWVTHELPGLINEGLANIDLKSAMETLSQTFINALNGISDFIAEVDWEQVGKTIGDFISGIDWAGILESVAKVIGEIIKNTPSLLSGILENLDAEGEAVILGSLFAPKLISTLVSQFTSTETFAAMQTVGRQWATKIGAGVSAFFVGWSIGTIIYDKWGEEIDEFLYPIYDQIVEWGGDISDFFNNLWDAGAEGIEDFVESWSIGWDSISGFFDDMSNAAADGFTDVENLWTGWKDFWTGYGEEVSDNVQEIKDYLGGIKKSWTSTFESVGETVFDKLDEIGDSFTDFKDDWGVTSSLIDANAAETITNITNKARQLKDDWATYFGNMGDKAYDKMEDIKDTWRSGAQTISEKVETIKSRINGWIDNFKDGISGIRGKINDFKGYFDEIRDKVGNVISNAWNWGRDCIQSFINGANSLASTWTRTWESFGEKIYDYLHFSEPDKGPLSKESGHPFSTYAPDLVKTFAEGIDKNKYILTKSMEGLMEEVETPMTDINGISFKDGSAAAQGAGTITLVLTNEAGEIIARTSADALDVINGARVDLAERGLA